MTRFDGEDAACRGEVGAVHDVGSGAEVGANTDTFTQLALMLVIKLG